MLLHAYSPGKPSCGLWLGQGFPASALGECLGSKPRGFFDWAGGRGEMNQGLQLGALQRDTCILEDAVVSPGWWEGTQQGWVQAPSIPVQQGGTVVPARARLVAHIPGPGHRSR